LNVGTEEDETLAPISNPKFAKKFGQSPIFIASTQLVEGETLKHGNLASQLTEAIHVISCGYEEKTEWGKEVSVKKLSLVFLPIFLSKCLYKSSSKHSKNLLLNLSGWVDLWFSYRRYIDRF